MVRILSWMNGHKWRTLLFIFIIFITPLLTIHLLFVWSTDIEWLTARWTPGDLMGYVSGFEAFIGTVTLSALALWQNQQIHNQHIESLEPILSMKLTSIKGILYLIIENTGECEAKDIEIKVTKIENNGDNGLQLGYLFENKFELYPHEVIQECVAFSGENTVTDIFPKIYIKISYLRPDLKRKKEYYRTVVFDGGYMQKSVANVHEDTRKITSDIDSIARATVRIANYLDGHQIIPIDELSILSGRSLQNDLASVIKTAEKVPIVNREQVIKGNRRKNKEC